MRTLSDRVFAVCAVFFAVGLTLLTVLYPAGAHPPGLDHGFIRGSLVLVMLLVVVVRVGGSLIGGIVALLLLVAGMIALGWLTGLARPDADAVIDMAAVVLVGSGMGIYVGVLSRQAAVAAESQKQQALVLDMSVDLVPRQLDSEALSRMLHAIRDAAGVERITLLALRDDGVVALDPGESPAQHVDEATLAVARLMLESYSDADLEKHRSANEHRPQPLVTEDRESFIPVLSSHGIEGVLYAERGGARSRWNERELEFLLFAANLIGALIERQYLQEQFTRVGAMEEADRLKANIVLSVSHDLKTPIAAATATLTSVIDRLGESTDLSTRDDLMSVKGDLKTLDKRVTELVDIARLETASWKSNIDYNDIGDLCNLVRDTVDERQRHRVVCPDTLGMPPLPFDLVQLGRALYHIVENALAYSPAEAPVHIEVEDHPDRVLVSVVDQGPGLSEADRGRAFDKFFRGAAAAEVPHGSGLGLSIASKIIEGHRGRIEIGDVSHGGARFTVTLPRGEGGSS